MLRVGYTCHDSLPSSATSTQQIVWTLVEVSRRGVDVALTIPAFEAGATSSADVASYYGVPSGETPQTFHVTATGTSRPTGQWARGWFDWRVASRLRGTRQDLAWTRDPVAAVSLLRAGVPTVFETYRADFATRAVFQPWRAAVLRHRLLRAVITHSRLTTRAFVACGLEESRCLTAYNGFAPAAMAPTLARASARAQLDLPADERLVVYTGHIGAAKGTDVLVDLAVLVPDARFVIVGAEHQPGDAARLLARATDRRAGNLIVRPHVPVAVVSAYLYAADCLIIPPTDEPLRIGRTVLPMKLFSYMASGRAILAPRLPDIEEVLHDGDTACLVPPRDAAETASALTALLADRARMDRLGERAQAASGAYTWAARARRIVDFLERVSAAPRSGH